MVAHLDAADDKNYYLSNGYSSVVYNRINSGNSINSKLNSSGNNIYKYIFANKDTNYIIRSLLQVRKFLRDRYHKVKLKPQIIDYSEFYRSLVTLNEESEDTIPQLVPQWDHTPRSGMRGTAWINATPIFFYKHAVQVLSKVRKKSSDLQIVLLKSWNEWGETNYMEPDLLYGHAYLNALKEVLK